LATAPVTEAATLRRLRMAGLLLLSCLALELAVVALIDWRLGLALAQMVALEVVSGREAGIPVAIQAGAPPWLVIGTSFLQDLGVAATVFPWLVGLLERGRHRSGWLDRRLQDIDAVSQRHAGWATRWGPLGIFAFMLVPFLVNGPLVGAFVGRAAAIPVRRLIAPILASTLLAIVAWTLFYGWLFDFASGVHPALPASITLLIVATALAGVAWSAARDRRRHSG
jgi:uncharacterized membrane protein